MHIKKLPGARLVFTGSFEIPHDIEVVVSEFNGNRQLLICEEYSNTCPAYLTMEDMAKIVDWASEGNLVIGDPVMMRVGGNPIF